MRRNEDDLGQVRPSVYDRIPRPRGRRHAGIKTDRPGYPALILGQSAATKTLVEVAALQPVTVNDLPERANVTDANLGYTVRRLVVLGLVRRYGNSTHLDRYFLTLDRRHPLAELVFDVLHSIADANGLTWTPSPSPSENLAVDEGSNVTNLRIFGRPPGDVETIFGHPNRTTAVLVCASLGAADASTIARIAGVRTDGDMHRLLDPLEADGVLTSRMIGSIRLYRLVEAPWTSPLIALCQAVLHVRPDLASGIAPARTLLIHGQCSGRVHLRAHLGLQPMRPRRRRRRR